MFVLVKEDNWKLIKWYLLLKGREVSGWLFVKLCIFG